MQDIHIIDEIGQPVELAECLVGLHWSTSVSVDEVLLDAGTGTGVVLICTVAGRKGVETG
jgi:hypothetical protein